MSVCITRVGEHVFSTQHFDESFCVWRACKQLQQAPSWKHGAWHVSLLTHTRKPVSVYPAWDYWWPQSVFFIAIITWQHLSDKSDSLTTKPVHNLLPALPVLINLPSIVSFIWGKVINLQSFVVALCQTLKAVLFSLTAGRWWAVLFFKPFFTGFIMAL